MGIPVEITSGVIGALIGIVGTRINDRAKEQSTRRHERKETLRSTADDILRVADECLHENETALSGLPNDRRQVAMNMQRLFREPRQRGRFADWEQFLGDYLAKETDKRVREQVGELLSGVLDLERAFYSDYESAESIQDRDVHDTMKSFVGFVLEGESTWSGEAVVEVQERYLKFLRKTVERIGRAAGRLQNLIAWTD